MKLRIRAGMVAIELSTAVVSAMRNTPRPVRRSINASAMRASNPNPSTIRRSMAPPSAGLSLAMVMSTQR